jgi:predicted ester cyclase
MIHPRKHGNRTEGGSGRAIRLATFAGAGLVATVMLATPATSVATGTPAAGLTMVQARQIVAPLYDALNEPSRKDVAALLAQATNPDYTSCSTNQDCLDRDHLAVQFKTFGVMIPDLHWAIMDIRVSGNTIIVRGEATGTPVAALFGVKPTGRSFKTISLDLFTVKNGKLETAYHVENWTAAMQQIKGS